MAFDELTYPLPGYLLGLDFSNDDKKDISVMRVMKIEGEQIRVIRKYVAVDPEEFKKEVERVKDMFFKIALYNEQEIRDFSKKNKDEKGSKI